MTITELKQSHDNQMKSYHNGQINMLKSIKSLLEVDIDREKLLDFVNNQLELNEEEIKEYE